MRSDNSQRGNEREDFTSALGRDELVLLLAANNDLQQQVESVVATLNQEEPRGQQAEETLQMIGEAALAHLRKL